MIKRWAGLLLVFPWALLTPWPSAGADDPPRPIRALLVLGGCCHDYARQKDLLTRGISRRTHVEWTVAYDPDTTTQHKNPVYDNPDWAKGFDVIVHDECTSGVNDMAVIERILGPHKDGLPGVVLHCGMHSYRTEGWNRRKATPWMQFTGLISTGHGPQQPIAVTYLDKQHPITGPLGDWTTVNEELYNNAAGHIEPTAHALARGVQGKAEWIVTWTNTYNGKTRVFSTTLGHNNATVADPRYLDLVTRGLLWSVDKLDDRHLKAAADLVPEDLAKGKPATASSTQSPDHGPGAAVDGNPATRWCADGDSAPQWWQVDLGKPQDLTGIRIVWEQDGVNYRYKVEGSEDGKSWTMLSDQTNSDGRDQDRTHEFLARGVRHVRITATKLQAGAWASIFEVQVFGTEKVPAPAGAAALPPRLRRAGPDGLLGEVRIPDGFRATLFARPPDVRYPTCLAAAPTGEVFVGVNENGSLDAKPGRGRVVRCIDEDDDGKADRFNVFAAMDSPRGLVWDAGTLYVLHPPDLTAYHDDNGDGKADRSETLVKGLGFDLKFRGADHTTNGIRLGIDGYLYVAVGDYGFIKAVGKDGATLSYRGGGVVRVRTDGTGLEPVSRGQRNIYDVAIDPYMNLFTRDNTNDGDGWDVRLSHVVPTGHLGYPSLFKNFAGEFIRPMADYGGGSPTGSLYLQEPGLPAPYGDALYTCEWGREGVFRHPLEPAGAGFKAGQEPFVMLPRPTDIDVNGQSRIFISSWRGASFTYAGPNVGYVIRVTGPVRGKAPSGTAFQAMGSRGTAFQAVGSRGTAFQAVGSRGTAFQAVGIQHGQDARATLADHGLEGRATPADHGLEGRATQKAATDAQLVEYLASPGQVLRLAAQRAILRRGNRAAFATKLEAMARADGPMAPRVAAIFTLEQLLGPGSIPVLVKLAGDPKVREFALLALSDRKEDAARIPAAPFIDAMTDADPRVRLRAVVGLGRLGKVEAARGIVARTADDDPLVAHVAVKALVALNEVNAALAALDPATPRLAPGAARALQAIYSPKSVNGLIARLDSRDERIRRLAFGALCRLDHREADYKGDWWGTRPDTSGPYYKPVAWEQTPKIERALGEALKRADSHAAGALLIELVRNKVDLKDAAAVRLDLAGLDAPGRAAAVNILITRPALSDEAARFLGAIALSDKEAPGLRARALGGLSRRRHRSATGVLAAIGHQDAAPRELLDAWRDYVRDDEHARHVAEFRKLVEDNDPARRELGYAVLLALAADPRTRARARADADRAIEAAWKAPGRPPACCGPSAAPTPWPRPSRSATAWTTGTPR